MQWLYRVSIRTRLLVTYIGFILIGFSILTVIAAGQIQTAIQADYEQHLQDQVRLMAMNVGSRSGSQPIGPLTIDERNKLLKQAMAQQNAQLAWYPASPLGVKGGSVTLQKTIMQPQIKVAVDTSSIPAASGKAQVAERAVSPADPATVAVRKSDTGQEAFYTAVPVIASDKGVVGILQLSVPTRDLYGITMRYWATLGIGFLVLTTCALLVALLMARSITRPLYRLRASAQRLSQGDLEHRITFTWTDEIAEVATAFNEMAQRIQKMLEEQRAFASNVSHELRTPLTAIRLRTEALRNDSTFVVATSATGKDTSTRASSHAERGSQLPKTSNETAQGQYRMRQYIEEIDDEVVHLSNLVEELILLSQFEAGRAEIGQEQIDLTRMATALIRQLTTRAEASKIKLILTTPGEPVLVAANISHFKVVFSNLLDNALKYTSEHGSISWHISVEEDEVHCVIQDNGQGIAAQELPHLFERFYRVDKARSRAIPGSGLGLAIVKSIVDAYHGRVIIESDGPDQGTTVHVYWPDQHV